MACDAVPAPAAFTARSLTEYVVPLVRPGITTGDAVPAGSLLVHAAPLSTEYW